MLYIYLLKIENMIKRSLALLAILCSLQGFAQDDLIKKVINNASSNAKFMFTDMIDLEDTSIKNQGSAGTCWSYSGNSFIESEMMRMGKQPIELAPVYTARMVYQSKARNYILLNGNMGLGGDLGAGGFNYFWAPKEQVTDPTGFKSLIDGDKRAWTGFNVGVGAGAGFQWSKQDTQIYKPK